MYENLKYRRQFLVTNEAVDELKDWQHQIIKNVHLYAHPDLEITRKGWSGIEVILIGYIFDPVHPEKNNDAIVTDIVSKIKSFEDLINIIKPLPGSYAIIYKDENDFIIFHDPLGIREIYYCTKNINVICGSQPNLINEYSKPQLGITRDENIIHFYNYDMKFVRTGRLWVGDETYFNGIKHLLPNHCLDLLSLKSERYWPNRRLEKIDMEMAVKGASEYLKGIVKAVTLRYKVMMAITAGNDSRSLLAASKEVSDKIYYFINKEADLNDKSADITIPKKIFAKLNIPFHVHNVEVQVDEEFRKIFRTNVFGATDRILPTIYNIYYKNHQDKVNLLGVGEMGRDYYGKAPRNLDGYYLARCLNYKRSKYATAQCEKWLQEVQGSAKKFNVDIMKLLLWEMLLGKWGANANSESDIAIEEFDPYDSRYIYEILLSVDQSQHGLFEQMIKMMWPELLEFPINPPETLNEWVKCQLKKAGIYQNLKKVVYIFDRWRFQKL